MAGAQRNRTHCPKGHPYDAVSGGRRRCYRCKREAYQAKRPHGPTFEELIEARFQRSDGCWLWTGAMQPSGYGTFRGRAAHRITYELFVGPIPENLTIDHLCRVRSCVNPAHLEPVTIAVNVMRGESLPARNARKTHCPQGHPYDDENTYVNPTTGWRLCRSCAREARRARNGG